MSANLTFMAGSDNQKILEMVCKKRGLGVSRFVGAGEAIIPVLSSLEDFRGSLDRKVRKEFRRFGNKLDKLGSWSISCCGVDRNSVRKVWAVEKYSWKNELEGKKNAIKNWGIGLALSGAQRGNECGGFFDSELWFLDLNDMPIAYVLVLKRHQIVFFAKTSYDQRFRAASPGKFLMNALIERVFQDSLAKKIDFFSNLPFVRFWKPVVKKRVTIKIEKRSVLSGFLLLVFGNRFSSRFLKFVEQLQWKRKVSSM